MIKSIKLLIFLSSAIKHCW